MKQEENGSNKKFNRWKFAFILLLAAQLAFLAVIASRVIEVREPVTGILEQENKNNDISIGVFSTSKDELNKTLANYVSDLQTKNFSYQFYASSTTMLFEGTYTFLGFEVPLYIYFEPYTTESGAIQLKVTSFSAGTLPLPEGEVLKYIAKGYDWPEFVTVDSQSSIITIDLTKLKNSENIYLKARTIDLKNDVITFEIYKKIKNK